MPTDRTPPTKKTPSTDLDSGHRPRPQRSGSRRADSPTLQLGAEGELRAAQFLERRGYRILARNLRLDGVEVDLIASLGRTVAFIEVKTRRSRRFGPPESAVDGAKQARIVRAARAWLREAPRPPARIRFDVIACCVSGSFEAKSDDWQIVHLEAAFDGSS